VSHKLRVKDRLGEREVLLIDTVAVGRDPRCDISAADPLLSRRHAEFVASGPSVIVRDLNSRNGILVNGRKLREALLRPGDVVQISELAVTFLSSIDVLATAPPAHPAERRLQDDGANQAAAAPDASGPGDEKTTRLTPVEIEAVAAASAAGNREPASNGTLGRPAKPSNGAKRNGAWSVQVLADDDRTRFVPPLPSTLAGDVAVILADARADADVSGPPIAAGPAALPGASTDDHQARAVVALPTASIAVRVLALAILCFIFGVASTMIWLQPPLTLRWLLVDHEPVAVLLSFVIAVTAAIVVVIALRNATRRVESGRETPVE
jgi:hypothetical protein